MLTIYAPLHNPKSKAFEVFKGIQKSWPEKTLIKDNSKESEPEPNSMFWGFVSNNLEMIQKLESRKHNYWFTDTPYFGRFDNNNLLKNNHYWRICKNKIHAKFIPDCKSDRFDQFKINIKAPDMKGSHILVCPSSATVNNYIGYPNWTEDTVNLLKKITDRPIRIREKPRGRGTSGPSVAKTPLSEDLRDSWACVTSCSISAVEAVCLGKPVFCHEKSFASPMGNLHLEDIETPAYLDPEPWLYSLAYQQYTPEEFENGKVIEFLLAQGLM